MSGKWGMGGLIIPRVWSNKNDQTWSNIWKTSAQWGFNWERCLDCQQKLADKSTNKRSWPAKWGTSTTKNIPKCECPQTGEQNDQSWGTSADATSSVHWSHQNVDQQKWGYIAPAPSQWFQAVAVFPKQREAWNHWVSLVHSLQHNTILVWRLWKLPCRTRRKNKWVSNG